METMTILKGAAMVASVVSAFSQSSALKKQQKNIAANASANAQNQANALAEEGRLASKNKAQEVATRTGAARASFLSSGLTMDGTPGDAVNSMFASGLEDVRQIGSNYESKARNAISNIIFNANMQNMDISRQRQKLMSDAFGSVMDFGAGVYGSKTPAPTGSPPIPQHKPVRTA